MSVVLRSAPGVTPAVLHNLGTTCAKEDEKDAVYAVDTYNQSIANTAASIRAAASDVDHIGAVLYRSADYGTSCAKPLNLPPKVETLTPWDSQGNQISDGTGRHVFPTIRGCGGAGYQAGYVLTNASKEQESFESYGLDRASFNQGANAQYGFSVLTEQQPTLVAKGPGAVCAVQRGEDSNE